MSSTTSAGFAYYEGRWDDAIELYEQGRNIRLRTGNAVEAALVSCNIGEVLTDQGRLEEAGACFRDALRVARAAGKPYVAATALQHLGRVAMLGGEPERGLELLNDARARFEAMRNADDVSEVDVLLAECHLLAGNPTRALEIVAATSVENPTRLPTLERTRGGPSRRSATSTAPVRHSPPAWRTPGTRTRSTRSPAPSMRSRTSTCSAATSRPPSSGRPRARRCSPGSGSGPRSETG